MKNSRHNTMILLFLILGFFFFVPRGLDARVPEYHGGFDENCLDSNSIRKMFWDGNLEALGHKLDNYFASTIASGAQIPLPCWAIVAKYYGVIAIAVKLDSTSKKKDSHAKTDTALGQIYFASLLKVDPHAELFDLGVPLGIQSVFDGIKQDMKITYTPDENFARRLIPPPDTKPAPTERAFLMREKYHDLRSCLYLAVDSNSLVSILKSLVGEKDPGFLCLNSEIYSRVGAPLLKAKKMIEEAEEHENESEILAPESIAGWTSRLRTRINDLELKTLGPGSKVMRTTFGSKDDSKKKNRPSNIEGTVK